MTVVAAKPPAFSRGEGSAAQRRRGPLELSLLTARKLNLPPIPTIAK